MVELNCERINQSSPYKVEKEEDGFVQFVTDFNVRYTVGFEKTDGLLSFTTYQFIIINVNNKKSPNDPKLKDAILAIVVEFFRGDNSLMLYICETGDAKQKARNRLFQSWYNSYLWRMEYTMLSANIKDEDGVINYTALIVKSDNPNLPTIAAEFTRTVQLLCEKPD